MNIDAKNLVWLDLEMTGLDPEHDEIIEIATVVTDKDLNILAAGPSLAIHQPEQVLQQMNEWCINQHNASGLTERVRQSKISVKEAEQLTLEFLAKYVPAGASPLCGNTICQDRRFLAHYMPTLEQFFHYRNLDVSVLKMLAKMHYPHVAKGLHKKTRHEALSDVYDSIDEMRYYVKHLLIQQHQPEN